jgi:SAM-dependent methyltransferase
MNSAAWDAALNSFELLALGRKAWWWRLHAAASRRYFLDPPPRIMRRESAAMGLPDGQCVYGETPAVSMLTMLKRVQVTPQDVVYDLGCGRGIALMAAALDLGVHAVGVDVVPTLVARARDMAQALGIADLVQFEERNFLDADLSRGTIFYVASTTFDRTVMRELARKIEDEATPPLRAITLSQPLGGAFEIVGKERYPMTWGWCTVYFQTLA